MTKKRILILASGRGSNMESILKAIDQGQIAGEAVGVISSNPDAPAIEKCCQHNIPYSVVDRKSFSTKADFQKALLVTVQGFRPDLICLAGFMHILGSEFIGKYRNRIINIHPSLLPSFPGLNAQEQALQYGVRFSGCTVHFVDEGMDTGPIILQAVVPVHSDDDAQSLAARILVEEHRIYPEAVRLFCLDQLKIIGRRVIIDQGGKVNG